jgi:HAD superfamily hydrolase (TIGR01509 family)
MKLKAAIQATLVSLGLFMGYYKVSVALKPQSEDTIKAVIFDLDGVLFTTSKKIYTKIAPFFPLYAARRLFDGKGLHVKEHYLEVLSQVKGKSEMESFHQGKAMPQIMVDWQTGTDVYDTVKNQISGNKSLPYAYKKLMLAIAENVFNPHKFVASRTTIKKGIQMLKAIKAAGYKVYVLSNWDAQSFPILQKKHHKIMDLFDGTFISGEAGVLKPNPEIFTAFLKKFELKASECVFIDDEKHNVAGAESVGIKAVLFDKKKSGDAIDQLEDLQILKKDKK